MSSVLLLVAHTIHTTMHYVVQAVLYHALCALGCSLPVLIEGRISHPSNTHSEVKIPVLHRVFSTLNA
jgi:hypothetical protein